MRARVQALVVHHQVHPLVDSVEDPSVEVALVEVGNLLKVEEHTVAGYPARTMVNAKQADLTLAFAHSFDTAGERLTKKYAGTKWYGVLISAYEKRPSLYRGPEYVVYELNARDAKTINIAGNGIYSLIKLGMTQEDCDLIVLTFLERVVHHPDLKNKIELIRSGGQTGFDEAGIKAAQALFIPALALLPKDYLMRDESGKDKACTLEETIQRLTYKS